MKAGYKMVNPFTFFKGTDRTNFWGGLIVVVAAIVMIVLGAIYSKWVLTAAGVFGLVAEGFLMKIFLKDVQEKINQGVYSAP